MMRVFGAVLVAAAVHAAIWHVSRESVEPADTVRPIQYLSYSPYHTRVNPKDVALVPADQIERDLERIAEVSDGLRTYSVSAGLDRVPEIAADLGLDVVLGAWIGDTESRDREEMDLVAELSRANRNVRSVLVGNEVLLRKERTVDELIALVREVKRQVHVPVSTSEIWYLWLQHPELVSAVDYISVHILPYWEGVAAEQAVPYTMERLEDLRKAYPGKKIVISEFGWPSQGYNNLDAKPGALAQASVIREFLGEADRHGVSYNIIEAFDQPWKTNEGSVGAYWGVFDNTGLPKFALTGLVEESGTVWKAAMAVIVGACLTLLGLWRGRATGAHALAFAAAANGVGAAVILAAAYPFENYLNVGIGIMWTIGFVLIIPLTLISLTKLNEIFHVVLGRRPKRLIDAMGARPVSRSLPKISIHIPAYREQPQMLIQTLNGIAALDYPNFEVIVIVNNTPEAEYSAPVAEHCERLGPRFKFLDIVVKGFKAGALNAALEHTAPDAEIIALIDADYVVLPNWLSDLAPLFDDPRVALVQAPQDHRDGPESLFKTVMNSEYAGFFDVGMVQRNEDNAIIQHGTMCLMRRDRAGSGWRLEHRDHRRGHGTRPAPAGSGIPDALHQHPLRARPAAGYLRGVQDTALPLGLRRHADHPQALGSHAAPLEIAEQCPEAPLPGGMDVLAGRRARNRRGHPQSVVGSGDRVRRRGDPAAAVYRAHRRRLRDRPRALRGSLRQAGGHSVPLRARRGALRHEPATHRGAGGTDRSGVRRHPVHANRQGRKRQEADPKPRGVGGCARSPARSIGAGAGVDQRQAGHRTHHFRRDAGRSERAVPGGRDDAGDRANRRNPTRWRRRSPSRRRWSRCWSRPRWICARTPRARLNRG